MFLEKGKARIRSPYKIIRVFNVFWYYLAKLVENMLIRVVPTSFCKTNKNYSNEIIIASLTSYPGRINVVEYAVKSIFLQSVRPHKIILWLAYSQFPERKLPESLIRYMSKGLEIRWVEDLRSHKKYYYALQEQRKNELVITFDDDIIYHPFSIENVLRKHYRYPKAVISNMMMRMYVQNDKIVPFRQWDMVLPGDNIPRSDYALLTGSGCLYPYGIMPKETFDWKEAFRTSKTCDDLWITFITKIHNIQVCPTDYTSPDFCTSYGSQTSHLAADNMLNDGNDITTALFIRENPILIDYIRLGIL